MRKYIITKFSHQTLRELAVMYIQQHKCNLRRQAAIFTYNYRKSTASQSDPICMD